MDTPNNASPKTSAQYASNDSPAPTPRKKQRRGFAAMDPAKQREIASKGGRASHEKGTGHEWSSESARAAGRKGGLASHGGRGKAYDPTAGNANQSAA
ncbi:MAG: KGG domain-containing protein [Polyangiales bacterium]